jgi:protein SCO1/2
MTAAACTHESDLPKLFPVPNAALVDENAKPVRLDANRGYVTVYDFIFTSCSGTCPMMTATMRRLTTKVSKDGQVRFVSISVDPQRDTREVLEQYTQSFDPRIVGLTGDPQQIAAVAKEYGAYWAAHKTGPGAEDYVMDHSSYLYVMDPEGKFVRALDADTPGDRIADALRELMAQPREGGSHGVLRAR